MYGSSQAGSAAVAAAVQLLDAALPQATALPPEVTDATAGGCWQYRVHLWLCHQGPTAVLPGVTAAPR